MQKKKFKLGIVEAVGMLILVLLIMGFGVIGLRLSPQVPVLLAMTVVIFWAKFKGFSWDDINNGIKDGINQGIIPIIIFILIGVMISTWIAAGTIPTLMVYGFQALSARWFLPTVFLVCTAVGAAVGSCFTVVSTVGIAFFGIGVTMNFSPALVAGAIISGGICGDKLSPLSETNNLTAAVVDVSLFDHMKTILWSVLPAGTIATVLFAILGAGHEHADLSKIDQTVAILQSSFPVSAWTLLPIVLIFVCAFFKMGAIPTMLLNAVVSIGLMVVEQTHFNIQKSAQLLLDGYVAKTSSTQVNSLLSRGGINSMMPMVALIVLTLALGGLLVHFGLIATVMEPLAAKLNSPLKLVAAGLAACLGVNLFVGEQFLSIILPGRAFKQAFDDGDLNGEALGRVLEDGGTVINYLVPWGVGGVFIANTLGVATLDYLPWTFFILLCPVMSILSAVTGLGLKRTVAKRQVAEA
ncbi:Na+/H+ antiporter [Ligilactobacillus salitolerans]|uniref:Na+/H+ antiporter n=1 Tax=Ligilactobacillus salitolerans TaxID=1808352 RepID=A0A401IRD5_9LACO|nr:Na+/H+ antiporter NhaC family protein [Ligilactobacillus salitolerans]GBG94054.1 Na+/H+ antiporter [Ligilactobacillus salitolerans]